ncbi:MAG: CBS domain-containing protein/gamma-glutamyl:cysteine ligase YbdK (ATP-grasp superfamily) [Saprospiraceae bacterium]|jgi:CBS domain-containing protein/gamma-glutamyl:cysteine ligase YbdK (ATP-grasp superfamily)
MGSKGNRMTSRPQFVKALLDDVSAMEYMLEHDWFESDITRIGAEQEIVLIDQETYRPSLKGPEILERAKHNEWLVGELARFNLELNLKPQVFHGSCLAAMEQELKTNLKELRGYLKGENIDYLLTGILPTLHKYHLHLNNLTPNPRYKQLMKALHGELRGDNFELRLVGIDELLVRHDSPLMEACNTSFQVHLQVAPQDFVKYYNIALALTAPSISLAANSPIVFGKRLWHETRIALFQQAIDTRRTLDHMRQMSPRVTLGSRWLDNSVVEIFKEDIARFRTLILGEVEENSMVAISEHRVPKLKCLQLHNSTVYRWNRPCYGISDTGKPHLRIENRIFPAGPTILDEMANTAFWLGAMKGMAQEYDDITKEMSFEDVRDNFGKSARFGLDSNFTWRRDQKVNAKDLVLEELLPLAKIGLESMQVDAHDIDRYLGVIQGRMEKQMNGARWMLRSYTRLAKDATSTDEALTNLTAAIHANQNTEEDNPGHLWKEPELSDLKKYRPEDVRVSELMSVDLFTAQRKDLVRMVERLMKWRDISHMPVEDKEGNLIGLINAETLMDRLILEHQKEYPRELRVEDVMIKKPVTISPRAKVKKVIKKMKKSGVKCLPVVKGTELLGIITQADILKVLNRMKKEAGEESK